MEKLKELRGKLVRHLRERGTGLVDGSSVALMRFANERREDEEGFFNDSRWMS